MIVLRPGGRLCNHIRAIGSAIRLAQECGTTLKVDWFRCPIRHWAPNCGMRARFCDLFEPIDGVKVCEKIKIRNDFPWNWLKYSVHNPNYYPEECRKKFIEDMKSSPAIDRWHWDCFDFYHNPDFSWLKPRSKIMEQIEECSKSFGANCVGIHVRRTDNRAAIDGSPISLFIDKMNIEISKMPEVKFFISTDDMAVKSELKAIYGERLLSYDASGNHFTIKAEQDAVIDLYLLSRTSKIFGSYWSSFSEVASQIGNIPLEVLVQQGVKLPAWVVS